MHTSLHRTFDALTTPCNRLDSRNLQGATSFFLACPALLHLLVVLEDLRLVERFVVDALVIVTRIVLLFLGKVRLEVPCTLLDTPHSRVALGFV